MESPDSTGEEKEQPKQNPDPEIQAIIEQTAEAMSLPIGYIDGLIDEAKFRYCLYHFRHAFAHRSLASGNDVLTTATLMGHRSTATLSRVYAHLDQADEHLRDALKKTK